MTENVQIENDAIIRIQRVWRGYNARKYVAFLNAQATDIQRVWRGYLGRQSARVATKTRKTRIEGKFFDAMATQIQKVFRGYCSRKDKQDFYRRKQYVHNVTKHSYSLNQHIDRNIENLKTFLEDKRVVDEAKEFTELTENLHHLLGTKERPGVFHSAIGPEFHTTAYGLPMEDHIRDAFENKRIKEQQDKERAAYQRRQLARQARAHHQIEQARAWEREQGGRGQVTLPSLNNTRRMQTPPNPMHATEWGVQQRSVYGANPNNNGTPKGKKTRGAQQQGITNKNLSEQTILRQPRLVPMP
mmetsp:Transcript_25829/g.36526  ORF Transcript_25829/g.36526 Transcript_25829/m.36526 type:complete len:301 (+) Transcript_25829:183-1085(+)